MVLFFCTEAKTLDLGRAVINNVSGIETLSKFLQDKSFHLESLFEGKKNIHISFLYWLALNPGPEVIILVGGRLNSVQCDE